MAKACNKPFVLVNEDNISELIKDSDDENTKIQIILFVKKEIPFFT